MQCIIRGRAYNYIDNVMEDEFTRKSYFQLAKEIYKLKYEKWYQSGYMNNTLTTILYGIHSLI